MIRKSSSSTGKINNLKSSGALSSLKDITGRVHVGEIIPARILRAASENMYLISLLGKQMLAESNLKFTKKKILVKIESKSPKLFLKLQTDNDDNLSEAVKLAHENGIAYYGDNASITNFVIENFGKKSGPELTNLINIGNAIIASNIIPFNAILKIINNDKDFLNKISKVFSHSRDSLIFKFDSEYEDIVRYFFQEKPCPCPEDIIIFFKLLKENKILFESQDRVNALTDFLSLQKDVNTNLEDYGCCFSLIWLVEGNCIRAYLTENNSSSSQYIYESEIYEGVRLKLDSVTENIITLGVTNSYAMRYYKALESDIYKTNADTEHPISNCRFVYDIKQVSP